LRQDLGDFFVGVDVKVASSEALAVMTTLILPLLRSSLCQSAEFDDRVVEVSSHPTAKGNDHALAIGGLADFKVGDDVICDVC